MRDFEDELERRLLLAGPSLTWEAAQPRWRDRGSRRLAISLGWCSRPCSSVLVSGVFVGGSETALGREFVSFADASPLVVLEQAGWRVDYANEDSAQEGELHFTTGPVPTSPSAEDVATDAQLNWRPGSCRSGRPTVRTPRT